MSRTVEFCQKHSLQLNETRYQGLGVSGRTGRNMEHGARGDLIKALEAGEESVVVMAQIEKREATAKQLAKKLAVEAQRTRAKQFAVDSIEELEKLNVRLQRLLNSFLNGGLARDKYTLPRRPN